MAHEFTDANFEEEVLKNANPVFVDFWAPWCGPCRLMGPVIDNLVKEIGEQGIKIGKVNVDENTEIAGRFNIMSIPTFIIFKDGKPAAQAAGVQTLEQLKELIAKANA